ncbi:MAG TPA: DUF3306 domain-containing protein [Telluria sp.]|nr:DUF3306 domain-containing protein [Telluria sp.]
MADGFLSRWSRLKADARELPQPSVQHPDGAAVPATVQAPAGTEAAGEKESFLPTLEDAQRLGPQSDYSAFVARGVDPSVRRMALRKLFSDPHFNIGDGLDVYMGDYTRSDPISPAMLAALAHAGPWLGLGPKEDEAGELSPEGTVRGSSAGSSSKSDQTPGDGPAGTVPDTAGQGAR